MSALSQDHAGIVKALIEAAPDSAIRSLEMALSGDVAGGSLAAVKSIVDTEVYDRAVRDTVFEPITPLFSPRSDSLEQLQFPASPSVDFGAPSSRPNPISVRRRRRRAPAARGRRSHADDLR